MNETKEMITFEGIRHNTTHNTAMFNNNAHTFCLEEEGLKIRIRNLEKQYRNTREEVRALKALQEANK